MREGGRERERESEIRERESEEEVGGGDVVILYVK